MLFYETIVYKFCIFFFKKLVLKLFLNKILKFFVKKHRTAMLYHVKCGNISVRVGVWKSKNVYWHDRNKNSVLPV